MYAPWQNLCQKELRFTRSLELSTVGYTGSPSCFGEENQVDESQESWVAILRQRTDKWSLKRGRVSCFLTV